jgi:cytochrome d ubiquinol oxidase subunit II
MPALEILAALAILVSLILYALSGGADFGGGVWDLLASGPRAAAQRRQISHSIGPIWEANHIWLILAIVVLFTGFPAAFARITTVLHVPLLLALLGIVARGAAFSFRSYGLPVGRDAGPWGRLFASASLITPVLLGVVLGDIASGKVRPPASAAGYLTSWIGPLPIAVGLFALGLFAFLAAVYLAYDANFAPAAGGGEGSGDQGGGDGGGEGGKGGDGSEGHTGRPGSGGLSEDFRRRALATGVSLAPLAAAVLAAAGWEAPQLLRALTRTTWSWFLHAVTAACASTALAALVLRRFRLARIAAAGQAALILAGWAFAQYPFLVPPDLSLAAAAAPAATLRDLLAALAAGALLLLPAFVYLYRVFGRFARHQPEILRLSAHAKSGRGDRRRTRDERHERR